MDITSWPLKKKNANFLVVCSCSFGEDSEDSGTVVSTWQSFQTTYIHINAHIFIHSFIDTYDLLVPCTLPITTVVSELESLLKYDQNLLTFPKRLPNSIKLRTRGSCVHVFLHPSEVKMFFLFLFCDLGLNNFVFSIPGALNKNQPFFSLSDKKGSSSMSDLHNPRVATGKLVTLGNQKRWVEAIQLLGHHWKKSRLNMITLPETNIYSP